MRAAAHLHHIGIAQHDVHPVERHVQEVSNNLGKAGLVALAARLRADDDIHASVRPHCDPRLLDRSTDRGFDIIGKPAPEQFSAFRRLAPTPLESVPIGERHGPIHVLFVTAAVVNHSNGVPVRHRFRANQVLAAQLDGIEPEARRGDVDEPLDGERDFRPAGAAIGVRRHRVGEHADCPQARDRNRVGAGDQSCALRQRRQ